MASDAKDSAPQILSRDCKKLGQGSFFHAVCSPWSCSGILRFSHTELMFGHMPQGPLKCLHDKFSVSESVAECNVLNYVSQFCERLHEASSLAKESLYNSQTVMKRHYDRSAVPWHIGIDDNVFHTWFCSLCRILQSVRHSWDEMPNSCMSCDHAKMLLCTGNVWNCPSVCSS